MALIIPVGFVQAVYEMALVGDDEPIVTTMGHAVPEGLGGDYELMANDLRGIFISSVGQNISDEYTLTGVTLYVGQDGGPPAVYESTDPPGSLGGAGDPLPQNCAVLMRKRTSASGRRGRGRCYLPGIAEDVVEPNGEIGGPTVTSWQNRANAWFTALTEPGVGLPAYEPYLLHRSEGMGTEPPPTPITTFVIDSRIATQRRRLRK